MANSEVPQDWDRIREAKLSTEPESHAPAEFSDDDLPPQVLLMFGSAWGDLVSVLAVCTAALLALALLGYSAVDILPPLLDSADVAGPLTREAAAVAARHSGFFLSISERTAPVQTTRDRRTRRVDRVYVRA